MDDPFLERAEDGSEDREVRETYALISIARSLNLQATAAARDTRDFFAGFALMAILTSRPAAGRDEIARTAFSYADSMMKARENDTTI